MAIADWVEPRVTLDSPINIHLTGCHHSCAQHYIGDIGMIACRVPIAPESPNSDDTSGIQLKWLFLYSCKKLGFDFGYSKTLADLPRAFSIYYGAKHPFQNAVRELKP